MSGFLVSVVWMLLLIHSLATVEAASLAVAIFGGLIPTGYGVSHAHSSRIPDDICTLQHHCYLLHEQKA
ncbi:MAG: hypothetical protein OWR52_00250 [Acidibacillus sp.]|nr:hypothetical protein [Acidibacillus sp.]